MVVVIIFLKDHVHILIAQYAQPETQDSERIC